MLAASYCDFIAYKLHKGIMEALLDTNPMTIIDVTPVEFDLHPKEGYMVSTKKTFHVMDANEKTYTVTIEESK